jgi:response regulator NasT
MLKIMVVDDHAQRACTLARVLTESGYHVVAQVAATDYLPARITESQPDVILIDVDAPSRDTLEQVSAIHRETPRPVIMFSNNGDRETIAAAIAAGVSAYQVDGLAHSKVQPIIDVAIAHFQRFQHLQNELDKAQSSLASRKLVDRAKGVLMAQRQLTEPQAYRTLQKLAMDRKRRLVDVARDVIEMADLLSSKTESHT